MEHRRSLVGAVEHLVAAADGDEQARVGELAQLLRGEVRGRVTPQDITLFKSVGTALEDLAAASLVVSRCA